MYATHLACMHACHVFTFAFLRSIRWSNEMALWNLNARVPQLSRYQWGGEEQRYDMTQECRERKKRKEPGVTMRKLRPIHVSVTWNNAPIERTDLKRSFVTAVQPLTMSRLNHAVSVSLGAWKPRVVEIRTKSCPKYERYCTESYIFKTFLLKKKKKKQRA